MSVETSRFDPLLSWREKLAAGAAILVIAGAALVLVLEAWSALRPPALAEEAPPPSSAECSEAAAVWRLYGRAVLTPARAQACYLRYGAAPK
jgi:hypothetical protein